MSNIADFIAEVNTSSGMARANRYAIDMGLPRTLAQFGTYSQADRQRMHLFCEAVTLPGININTTQIRTYGEVREMPYELNYDPVQFSFYVSGDMIVKGIFDQWIKSIQQGNTRNFNYYKDYISPKMEIWVDNMTDDTVYKVDLYEAYPKTVSAVQLGYDQKDVMKITVSMMYKYWDSEVTDRPSPSPDAYVMARANTQDVNLIDSYNSVTGTIFGLGNSNTPIIDDGYGDNSILSNVNAMGDVIGYDDYV